MFLSFLLGFVFDYIRNESIFPTTIYQHPEWNQMEWKA